MAVDAQACRLHVPFTAASLACGPASLQTLRSSEVTGRMLLRTGAQGSSPVQAPLLPQEVLGSMPVIGSTQKPLHWGCRLPWGLKVAAESRQLPGVTPAACVSTLLASLQIVWKTARLVEALLMYCHFDSKSTVAAPTISRALRPG